MKTGLLTTIITASLIAAAGAARADDEGFYIGLNGDVAMPAQSDVSGGATGFQKYSFSSGADMSFGWEPEALKSDDGGGVRLELQGGYHAFGLDSVRAGAVTNTNPSGDMKAYTGMANVFYDFGTSTAFTPYIGAGVGVAHVTIPSGNGLGNTGTSDTQLAYQGMAGIAYTMPSLPQADWTVGYRYLAVDAPSFSSAGGNIKISPVNESALELGVLFHF